MTGIFKKQLLKKETPFLSKIVPFRHKIAWASEKKAHSQKSRDTCLIICHKEAPPTVLAKSRTRTPDHLLVSRRAEFRWYRTFAGHSFVEGGVPVKTGIGQSFTLAVIPLETEMLGPTCWFYLYQNIPLVSGGLVPPSYEKMRSN